MTKCKCQCKVNCKVYGKVIGALHEYFRPVQLKWNIHHKLRGSGMFVVQSAKILYRSAMILQICRPDGTLNELHNSNISNHYLCASLVPTPECWNKTKSFNKLRYLSFVGLQFEGVLNQRFRILRLHKLNLWFSTPSKSVNCFGRKMKDAQVATLS